MNMPLYKFKCDICGTVFEKPFHMEDDKSGLMCPNGHKQVHRVYAAPNIVFKGSGFYVTDYKKNGAVTNGSGSGNPAAGNTGKNGGKPGENSAKKEPLPVNNSSNGDKS